MQVLQSQLGSVQQIGGSSLVRNHARQPARAARMSTTVRSAATATTPKGTVMGDQVELGKTGAGFAAKMVQSLTWSSG